ncbi:MAG: hypothetical protein AAF226_04885 [Verrucomicrobiota bacterium]
MANAFSIIQDTQDALVDRFCKISRRLQAETPWFDEEAPIDEIEAMCLERILFFEARGFYMFQEPQIEHQPALKRLRVILTFKPSESNQ